MSQSVQCTSSAEPYQTQYLKVHQPHNPGVKSTNIMKLLKCIIWMNIALAIIISAGVVVYTLKIKKRVEDLEKVISNGKCDISDGKPYTVIITDKARTDVADSRIFMNNKYGSRTDTNKRKPIINLSENQNDLKQLEIDLSLHQIQGIPKVNFTEVLKDIASDITTDILQNYGEKTKSSADFNKYSIDSSQHTVNRLRNNIFKQLKRASNNGYSFDQTKEIKLRLREHDSYNYKIIYAKMRIISMDNGNDVDLDIALSLKTESY